jgi:hypothetical protein
MATNWAAVASHVTSSYLDMRTAYEQSKLIDINSKLNTAMAGIEADQMMRQAIQMENVGVRQSQIEQYKTRATMSDATAAMAASGGVLDPEMLAKIKQRGDYNALSALFDARTRAIDMRYKAGMHRIGASWEAGEMRREGDALRREAWTGVAMSSIQKFWPTSKAQKPVGAGAKSTYGTGTYRKSSNKSVGGKGYVGGL